MPSAPSSEAKKNKKKQEQDDKQEEPSKWAQREAFFFNHGANIGFWTIYISLNFGMAMWGIWEFAAPHWTTKSNTLRITLPIARAGGRLVTFNTAFLLVTASKYFWTWVREKTAIPLGFPVDNIMPEYHRVVAWVIIVSGCVVHTIPQIVNYASKEIPVLDNMPIWTFGEGFSTKQLLYTGILLFIIFALFFGTTLAKVRATAIGFRLFWYMHLFGIISAFPLLIIHGTSRGHPILFYFVLGPLILYTGDTIIRRLVHVDREATISHQECFDNDGDKVVKLVLKCQNFEYQPGQYAELKIPSISQSEWHPFTIASAPGKDHEAAFYIKAVGRWTNQLYDLVASASAPGPSEEVVRVRGPHGAPAQNYLAYKHLIVIGSGIGVTPLLSVWHHLVQAGSEIGWDDDDNKNKDDDNKSTGTLDTLDLELEDEEQLLDRLGAFLNSVDIVTIEKHQLESFKGDCAYFSSVMESMTVNICVFCTSVAVETLVFSLWIFELNKAAAGLQLVMSMVALVVFGSKVGFSILAYGPKRYLSSWVCYFEICIVILDSVALFSSIATLASPSPEAAILYFTFHAGFVFVHGARIFHIFHATARPPESQMTSESSDGTVDKIRFITGIWVTRHYSGMSYAVPGLADTMMGLPSLFSLQLYGTREKEASKDRTLKNIAKAGRPNWETIFECAIEDAYASDPNGDEAVGVFFCGSPAIARVLQSTAQQVTARHQHATAKRDGKPSRCRILVHKENF
mmetsp:Transcript_12/g.13  ORF Transcript_12/g.13 Transcript_12/m.13 type:complete len:742 (+) Transcript_12:165-2390(+)